MEWIVDERVQSLIDAAFAIEEVLEKVLGGLPKDEIFANRRVSKAWRKAAFWALRSKGFVYTLPKLAKNIFEEFEEQFSVDCYIPLESRMEVSDDDDSLLALSKNYSKFVVYLHVIGIPAEFQFQWSEVGEYPRLEVLRVYFCDYHLPKFLLKIVHNSKYLEEFSISTIIDGESNEGDLPLELTSLVAHIEHTFAEPASFLPTHFPNLKVLSLQIYEQANESEVGPGTDLQLQHVQRVKTFLEKFSPQLEEFRFLGTDGDHIVSPYLLRLPKMDKLHTLDIKADAHIESADASKPLPQVLPKLKKLRLIGLRENVFQNMAALLPGENHGLEKLTLCFSILEEQCDDWDEVVEDGADWEAFLPLIRNLKALKSLHLVWLPGGVDLAVWFDAFHALPSLNYLSFQYLRRDIEVDPALVGAWTSAGREIKMWQL